MSEGYRTLQNILQYYVVQFHNAYNYLKEDLSQLTVPFKSPLPAGNQCIAHPDLPYYLSSVPPTSSSSTQPLDLSKSTGASPITPNALEREIAVTAPTAVEAASTRAKVAEPYTCSKKPPYSYVW